MNAERPLLLGCGILRREIRLLAERNGWDLDTHFLGSALHCDLDRLSRSLRGALKVHQERNPIVFYGCCHPEMEQILASAATFRTEGQNCIGMLLGHQQFSEELEQGAFFLLEEWAMSWERIVSMAFGSDDWAIIKEIFRGDRKYLLALRTPCSRPFEPAAQVAADKVGLPLRWMDVPLDHLQRVLEQALERKGLRWKS